MNGLARTFWAAVAAACLARAQRLKDRTDRWLRRHEAAEKRAKP